MFPHHALCRCGHKRSDHRTVFVGIFAFMIGECEKCSPTFGHARCRKFRSR